MQWIIILQLYITDYCHRARKICSHTRALDYCSNTLVTEVSGWHCHTVPLLNEICPKSPSPIPTSWETYFSYFSMFTGGVQGLQWPSNVTGNWVHQIQTHRVSTAFLLWTYEVLTCSLPMSNQNPTYLFYRVDLHIYYFVDTSSSRLVLYPQASSRVCSHWYQNWQAHSYPEIKHTRVTWPCFAVWE